jgi:hypothetical protein
MDYQGNMAVKVMDRIQEVTSLTPTGKEWLIAALDPFHDEELSVTGYPDINVAPSVVQLVKQTVQISCPAGITTGTWDLHVFNVPWWDSQPMWSFGNNVFYNLIDMGGFGPSVFNLGGICAIAVPTGTATWTGTGAPTPSSSVVISSNAVPDVYFDGAARVIAAGFETLNTTAPLYKQGQVIVYRMPQPVPQSLAYSLVDGSTTRTILGLGSYAEVRPPPATPANAQILTGSRTWDAEDGTYNVISFSNLNLPADSDSYCDPMIYNDRNQDTSTAYSVTIPIPVSTTLPGAGNALYSPRLTSLSPVNTSGAYYTGLSLQSTITLSWNVYVERFPSTDELDLATLAKPSAPYDILAQMLYTHALRDMPAGVPQGANGLGDWFAGVASKVLSAVGGIASVIPHPIAKGIGMGASAAGSVMDAFVAPPNSRAVVRGTKSEKKAAQSSPKLETMLMDSVLDKAPNSVDQAQNRRLTNLARRDKAMQQQLQAMSARISAINAKNNGQSRKKRK